MSIEEAQKIIHIRKTLYYGHYVYDDQDLKEAQKVLEKVKA